MNNKNFLKKLLAAFITTFAATLFTFSAFSAEVNPALFERAKNLYDVKEYRLALTLFDKILANEPKNGEALDFSSWCHRYLGNWESAKNGFEKAENLLPGDQVKWVKVGLGETWLGAGGYKEAAGAFSQAIEISPDDDELVIRSLKGLVIAYASVGDKSAMEETLKRLAEKEKAAADDIAASARSLLEKTAETAGAEEKQKATVSDASERQEKVVNQSRADEKVDEEIGGGNGYEVLGFRLGDSIKHVLDVLKQQNIPYHTFEEPTKYGVRFHIVEIPQVNLPEARYADADGQACFLEEFNDKLLSVNIFNIWKDRKGNLALMDEFFNATSLILTEKFGDIVYSEDSGLHGEALWSPSGHVFIGLEVNATISASQGGNVTKVVSYNDLPGFQYFWEHVKKINKR